MKTLLLIILTFFSLGLKSVFSQPEIFNKVPPPDDRLNFENVTGITQDADGFMWFATYAGLYKYDGYQLTAFRHDPSNPNSIATDSLLSIAIDSTGIIWIGTPFGLERFNPTTGQFNHYQHDPENPESLVEGWIHCLLVDRDGTLWIGGAGLDKYEKETDSFKQYKNIPGDSTSLSLNNVGTIYEDKRGTIWIGTGMVWAGDQDYDKGGLNRMDKKTGTFTRYLHDPNNPESLISNIVTAIYEDSRGTFWVGTAGDGLHTMNRENGTFIRHTYDPKHPEKLSRPPFSQLDQQGQHREFITFINEDVTGAIWIGTRVTGINYYNPKTGLVSNFKTNKYFETEYNVQMPQCFFASRDWIIWIGANITGNIYRTDPLPKQIPHYETSIKHIISFYEEPNGILWMLNDKELIRTDKAKGIIKRNVIDENPSNVMERTLKIIKEDRQGNIWFGSKDGLFKWDKKKESFAINYKINPNNKYGSGNNVWTIYEDSKENFWIGKARGLSLLNRETGSATEFLIYPNDTAEFGKNGITSILEDKTGKLWIGTWYGGGLYQFNMETKEFKNMLNEKDVSCIFEDSDGILWVSCMDNLFKYDRKTNNFIPYVDSNSLSGITDIVSILEDNQKYLWFGAWKSSIVRLDPQRNKTVIYDKNHGVENDVVFHSAYKGQNGNLYFGDINGYFSFDPWELTKNEVQPNIVLTDFFLANTPVKPGKDGPLKESLLQVKEIRLNFNQNVFTFEFAALEYSNPEQTKYSCMLENYDTNWRKVNSERREYYFNVPPGKYIFHVKAMSSKGVWAEKRIDIIISPPWYKTWWAYIIYTFLFAFAVFTFDRIMRKRIIARERQKTQERELAQAKEIEKAYFELEKAHSTLKSTQAQLIQSEKMASLGELTAGIAHEIQNPLNFVNNFSDLNKELVDELKEELATGNTQSANEIADDIKENEAKINHHGKRAEAIVKGMLLHSRGSSGQKEPTDINALCDEYLRLSYHGFRAKDKSFNADFKLEVDESLPKIEVVPQDIGRVLLNLINNAFYAVNEKVRQTMNDYKPLVVVTTKLVSNIVEIRVQDNGKGIPDSVKEKIFQPFFTTKPTGQGTGLGLSLSYDIVKAHGGSIQLKSQENVGTEFIIDLPIS